MFYYLFSWLVVFLILGAIWYVLDQSYGTGVYRWFYNMTHRDPLPENVIRGFIYNRRGRARFSAATVISLMQSALTVACSDIDPLKEFISFFLEVPIMVCGFYLGPMLSRFLKQKDKILDKMDQFESGETTLSEEVKGVAQMASEAVREIVDYDHHAFEQQKPEKADEIERELELNEEAAPDEEPEPELEPDAKELMDRFIKGRGKNADD